MRSRLASVRNRSKQALSSLESTEGEKSTEDWIYHRATENTEFRKKHADRITDMMVDRRRANRPFPRPNLELCVSVVNPILRALIPLCALPLPLAASVGFPYNRTVRSTEFRYGFAFKF
jgi:hypothetical protein